MQVFDNSNAKVLVNRRITLCGLRILLPPKLRAIDRSEMVENKIVKKRLFFHWNLIKLFTIS